jgi:hypothetical protein
VSYADRNRIWFALQDKERGLVRQAGLEAPGWTLPSSRVQRLQEALRHSSAFSQAELRQVLPGLELSSIWAALSELCQDIALHYGSWEVAKCASVGFGGAFAGNATAERLPALLGLQASGRASGPASGQCNSALREYQRGFRAAWGSVPSDRLHHWQLAQHDSHPSAHVAGWCFRNGHQHMSIAILSLLASRWEQAGSEQDALLHEVRQSPHLGQNFADWLAQNGAAISSHPQLTARPQAMGVTPAALPVKAAQAEAPAAKKSPYDEQFRALDAISGKPLVGLPYCIENPGKAPLYGNTDEFGQTLRVASNDAKGLKVKWGQRPPQDSDETDNTVEEC